MTESTRASAEDPLELFRDWMSQAEQSELNDPNAAALATAGDEGPSVRMVLIKHFDTDGFRFFTNAESRKGKELAQNPRASLCIHWKSLRRQVRVDGAVLLLDSETSDEYFHSRSRRSQIAAAVSRQSRPLKDRETLEQAVEAFTARHEGLEIPRPPSWTGFVLKPEKIEFWSDGPDRLHNRLVFTLEAGIWTASLLYP